MKVVLLGAGHAHLDTVRRAGELTRAGSQVTVVDRRPVFLYSGAAPAVLARRAGIEAIQIPVASMAAAGGAEFVVNRVVHVDPATRTVTLADGRRIAADLISVALGSTSAMPFAIHPLDARVCRVKPLEDFLSIPARIEQDLAVGPAQVLIAGGGASAVELAANLATHPRLAGALTAGRLTLTVIARSGRLLASFPRRAGTLAHRRLAELGVTVATGCGAIEANDGVLTCADGIERPFDRLVVAAGLATNEIPGLEPLPHGPGGGVRVGRTLAVDGHPIFAGGDSACAPDDCGARAGVNAIRQAPVLRRNLMAQVAGMDTLPARYRAPHRYLLILNLGGGHGLAVRGGWVGVGRLWMALKERIDWAFVSTNGANTRPLRGGPPAPGDDPYPVTARAASER